MQEFYSHLLQLHTSMSHYTLRFISIHLYPPLIRILSISSLGFLCFLCPPHTEEQTYLHINSWAKLQENALAWNNFSQAGGRTVPPSSLHHRGQIIQPAASQSHANLSNLQRLLPFSLTHTFTPWLLSGVCEHKRGSVPGCTSRCAERQINQRTKRQRCFTHTVDVLASNAFGWQSHVSVGSECVFEHFYPEQQHP